MRSSPTRVAEHREFMSEKFMDAKIVRVECYAGYKADERPACVLLNGQMVDVAAVEDRWYSPGATYFRVQLNNGERYVLCRQEAQDVWTIEAFRAANADGPAER
jgi:hypothetical protein